MNNEIQIFNHEEFGEVRTIEIDGKIYFVGIDVAKALGYKDPSSAVSRKVHKDDKLKLMLPHCQNSKVLSKTTVIDESGVYSLVLASKVPSARKFQRWVTKEVLPTIRKTGTYLENFVDKQKNMWYNITVSRTIDSRSTNS